MFLVGSGYVNACAFLRESALLTGAALRLTFNQMVEHSISGTFAALGHPARVAIVERLRLGEAPVSELARPHPMSLAALSKHIQVLERAGIVRRRVEGRVHWIALDPRPLGEARTWLGGEAAFWAGRLDALEAALDGATAGELSA
jgi:DNA-binding transcriptional ArsR family regulator